MGLSTIIGLVHDVFFMLAIFSILRLEVDITFIAAVLTIVGYSINDTIVTFDRIRENLTYVAVRLRMLQNLRKSSINPYVKHLDVL